MPQSLRLFAGQLSSLVHIRGLRGVWTKFKLNPDSGKRLEDKDGRNSIADKCNLNIRSLPASYLGDQVRGSPVRARTENHNTLHIHLVSMPLNLNQPAKANSSRISLVRLNSCNLMNLNEALLTSCWPTKLASQAVWAAKKNNDRATSALFL